LPGAWGKAACAWLKGHQNIHGMVKRELINLREE